MQTKKIVTYHGQYNLEGGIDIVQNTTTGKIVAHTENKEAADEIIRILSEKANPIKK